MIGTGWIDGGPTYNLAIAKTRKSASQDRDCMNRVCLNMIVKNEAHVIERCLRSVRPFIDSWVIVDTGSTDGTQAIIRRFFEDDLPGELHERPWHNFGHNRTEALQLARSQGDYLFIIDADEVLQVPAGYQRPPLSEIAYSLDVEFAELRYLRHCLISSRMPWRWVGVLHEYLDCGQPLPGARLPDVRVRVFTDGARSQRSQLEKFAADAAVLEAALVDEPDNERYVFYLAQSYRDSCQPEAALTRYDQRAAMGSWAEEAWYSQQAAALLAETLHHHEDQVIGRYLRAYQARPQRGGETLGQLARYCRDRKHFAMARMFAGCAMAIPLPSDWLFVDVSWYQWRCEDEYAIASYWTGHFAECQRVCESLLAGTGLPVHQRTRVEENLRFAQERLREA